MYFDYDGENHMVHKAWGASAHSYYSYDADGKRVRMHPHNVTPTVFIYQGPDMLRLQMEKRENGDTVAQYTMGARGALEAQHRGETSSVYHFDMLGSTLALTGANQAVTDTLRYEAWGDVLASTGNTTNRHTWVGRERYVMTRTSDIALLGLRHYMPGIGRFTTLDPVVAGTGRHVYVRNSPDVLVDPIGLQEQGLQPPIIDPDCGDLSKAVETSLSMIRRQVEAGCLGDPCAGAAREVLDRLSGAGRQPLQIRCGGLWCWMGNVSWRVRRQYDIYGPDWWLLVPPLPTPVWMPVWIPEFEPDYPIFPPWWPFLPRRRRWRPHVPAHHGWIHPIFPGPNTIVLCPEGIRTGSIGLPFAALHELLHLVLPDASEQEVNQLAGQCFPGNLPE